MAEEVLRLIGGVFDARLATRMGDDPDGGPGDWPGTLPGPWLWRP